MQKKFKWLYFVLALALTFSSVPVQTAYAAEPTHNHSVGISESKVTLNVGESFDLDMVGTESKVSWTSHNENVARVNSDGVVKATSVGKTTITARVGLDVYKCLVTVMKPSLKVNKAALTLYVVADSKSSQVLKATSKGASHSVSWNSSNPAVAKVDDLGRVTAVAAGTTEVIASVNGIDVPVKVTIIQSVTDLNLDSMTLSTKGSGSSIKLQANVVGPTKKIKWTTSDKKVATVSNGKVTGKSTGTATITATANGISDTCVVTVNKDSISVSEEKLDLFINDTKQLKSNANKKETVVWSSSNPEVVAVSDKGYVTAKSKGTATITVSGNTTSDTCVVSVNECNTRIGEDTVELKTKGGDKTFQLGFQIAGKSTKVKWSSSDKSVVSVNGKGKLTAKKSGQATITATANGVSDSVVVIVKDYVPSVDLNYEEYVLYTGKGNKVTLKAVVDGPSKKATWKSSDPTVATVVNGKVTAVSEGEVVITATANGITEDCVVEVKESDIILGQEKAYLSVGETVELPVDVVGQKPTVKYQTTNPKVATVNNGNVTAKSVGTANIVVTANGVTKACPVTVSTCPHDWDTANAVVTREATCSVAGEKSITCKTCGEVQTESIPVIDHTFVESEKQDATCTTDGTVKYVCSVCSTPKQEVIKHQGHEFGEWVVITKPSNFTWGIDKQYCKNCPMENARLIAPVTHEDWEHKYEEVVTPPTCLEAGYTTYTCACGSTYTGNEVPVTDHVWGDWVIDKEATEESVGHKTRSCTTEGCTAIDEEEIPALNHEHTYTEEVVAPTCLTAGYTLYTCTCGHNYNDNIVQATGHTWNEGTVVLEPTCTTEGSIELTCTVCSEVVVDKLPINLEAHDENSSFETTVAATCTSEGLNSKFCSRCNKLMETEVTKATGHFFTEWETVRESQCEVDGIQLRRCTVCSFLESNDLDKSGHFWADAFTVDQEATCENDGSESVKCTVCSAVRESRSIPATGHDYPDTYTVDVPATCVQAGLESHACSTCGSKESQIIPIAGHTEVVDPAVQPECTSTGLTEGSHCEVCKAVLVQQQTVPAAGHTYEDVITDPTCVLNGYTTHTCTVCNNSYVDTTVPMTGHSFGDWTTVTPATCEVEGEISRVCSSCEYVDDQKTPTLGHDFGDDYIIDVEPTCLKEGSMSKHCSRCSEKSEAQSLKPSDHVWTDVVYTWTDSKSVCTAVRVCERDAAHVESETVEAVPTVNATPNCTDDGNTTHTATFKNPAFETQVENTIEPAKGHTPVQDKHVDPTCTSTGLTEGYHCLVCKEVLTAQETIGENGHSWDEGVVTKEPTCTEIGTRTHTCTVCSAIKNVDEPINPNNHKPNTKYEVTLEPTCTELGVKEIFCTLCDASLETETMPANDHTMGDYYQVDAPTCTGNGLERSNCVYCDHFVTRPTDPDGHDWEDTPRVDKEVTCFENGYQSYHCKNCEATERGNTIISDGHQYTDFLILEDATCFKTGTKRRICTVCGDEDDDVIPVKTHVETTLSAVPATCSQEGLTAGKKCTLCGTETVKQETIPKKSHVWGGATYSWPTDATCVGTVICTVCGDEFSETAKISVSSVAATCSVAAKTIYIATFTDSKFSQRENPITGSKLSHSYGTPTYEWNGTTSCTGTMRCTLCGGGEQSKTSTSITPTTTASTCENLGKTVYTAAFSSPYSNQTKEVPIKATGHALGDPVTVTNVTCTTDGIVKQTCTNSGCTYSVTETIKAPNHSASNDYRTTKAETCTEDGSESKYCTRCGVDVGTPRTRNKSGHDYDTPFYIWDNYTLCTGKQVCSRCGDIKSVPGTMQTPSVTTPATCTSTGITKHQAVFSSPFATQTKNETTPKLGHLYVDNKCVYCSTSSAGAYDANGVMLASWDELVNTYGLNITKDYSSPTTSTTGSVRATLNHAALKNTKVLIIDNSVTSIGSHAFYYCKNLTAITIPNSVTSIGEYAFKKCTGLTAINLPNSVTSIGSYTFDGCTGLTAINLPNSVTSIGEYTFNDCTGLTSITIPESVTSIGKYAFYGCTSLASITIPSSVTSIGKSTFYGCAGLTSVYLPNSVTGIGNFAFYGCKGLTSITIPNSVTSIGEYTFGDCTKLGSIIIPDSVTSIGSGAFAYCKGLTSITITNSVTSIDNNTFADCTGITSITIPNSVTSIDSYAFSGCENLTTICYNGTASGRPWGATNANVGPCTFSNGKCTRCNANMPAGGYAANGNLILTWENLSSLGLNVTKDYGSYNYLSEKGSWAYTASSFSTLNSIKLLVLPDSVKRLGVSALAESKIVEVVIPESVEEISMYAFMACPNLKSVNIASDSTSIQTGAFNNSSALTTICYDGDDAGFPWGAANAKLHNELNGVCTVCGRVVQSGFTLTADNYHMLGLGDVPTGAVVIPETFAYNGRVLTVTAIGSDTFAGRNQLSSITLPASISSIGDNAFKNCTRLYSIKLPDSVESISSTAFTGSNITTICYDGSATGFPWGATNATRHRIYNPFETTCSTCSKQIKCTHSFKVTLSSTYLSSGGVYYVDYLMECTLCNISCEVSVQSNSNSRGTCYDGIHYDLDTSTELAKLGVPTVYHVPSTCTHTIDSSRYCTKCGAYYTCLYP